MGWFVQPRSETKEAWLARNGAPATRDEVMTLDLTAGKLPVALVDNGAFHAAAILYDDRERDVLNDWDDRPITLYLVDRALLESEFPA